MLPGAPPRPNAQSSSRLPFEFRQELFRPKRLAGLGRMADSFRLAIRQSRQQAGLPVRVIPIVWAAGAEVKQHVARPLRAVGTGTRPRPVPRRGDQSGANRIQFDIAHRAFQVRGIQRAGEEAILPQMATAPLGVVECGRIFSVSPPESMGQRKVAFRYGDHVNMVGHETVAQDSCAVPQGMPG
jgi:hypothetical protein